MRANSSRLCGSLCSLRVIVYSAMVRPVCLESRRSRFRPPALVLAFKFQRSKMFSVWRAVLSCLLGKSEIAVSPPVLAFKFQKCFLSGGQCYLIHQTILRRFPTTKFSLYVHKGGLKPHTFHTWSASLATQNGTFLEGHHSIAGKGGGVEYFLK